MDAFFAPTRPVNQYFGVYPAVVVDNKDPENRFRVKVKFPWMKESDSKFTNTPDKEDMPSTWCRVASFMAGSNLHGGSDTDELRGAFFLPDKEDEVLVAFMFGSFREPIVIGQMFNGQDLPFWQTKRGSGAQPAGRNSLRGIRSRSGHMLSFVDTGADDAERIVIQAAVADENVYDQPAINGETTVDMPQGETAKIAVPDGSSGGHVISLDMTAKKESVLMADKTGEVLVKLDSAAKTLYLYSVKDVVLNAKETCKIKCKSLIVESDEETNFKAGTTWDQKSGNTMNIEAGGEMNLKGGPEIHLNPHLPAK
jgi:uncharacterized protein involved in type VI secretion and phage assembly